jgi:IS5 family transposase
MYKAEKSGDSFYDVVYEANIPEKNILRRISKVINWGRLKRYLKKYYYDRGRDAHNPLMMFKLLVLQFLYDISDRQLEESSRDRISFRWFVGLGPLDEPPDHTAYCRFRDRLGPETIKRLFDDIVKQAYEKRMILDRLSVVDSTDIEAKVNTYKMNEKAKEYKEDDPTKKSPDPDARYGYKNKKKPFFGYKCHMGMDGDTRIITTLDASAGNVADTEYFDRVHDPNADGVTADKGYDSEDNYEMIEDEGQRAAIIPKRLKGRKRGHITNRYPDAGDQQYYRRTKRKRPRIEPKFNEMKNAHGMWRARYWGLAKMRVQVFLTGIVVNLKRMVTLMFDMSVWKMSEARCAQR